jgi:uncharacterized protein (DUF983 family)
MWSAMRRRQLEGTQVMRVAPLSTRPISTGILRGLHGRCPACGQGPLFDGFLQVRPHCQACGNDNGAYPADDFPRYLTILLVGHIVLPLFIWSDRALAPAIWVQCAIWLPLSAALCLALLRPVKGAVVGLCWATSSGHP